MSDRIRRIDNPNSSRTRIHRVGPDIPDAVRTSRVRPLKEPLTDRILSSKVFAVSAIAAALLTGVLMYFSYTRRPILSQPDLENIGFNPVSYLPTKYTTAPLASMNYSFKSAIDDVYLNLDQETRKKLSALGFAGGFSSRFGINYYPIGHGQNHTTVAFFKDSDSALAAMNLIPPQVTQKTLSYVDRNRDFLVPYHTEESLLSLGDASAVHVSTESDSKRVRVIFVLCNLVATLEMEGPTGMVTRMEAEGHASELFRELSKVCNSN
ncbi:hypothetical protein HZC07_06310 [Candidatus Micrarchaeota archaeon]|nr:hypothetical protein [Candidatus Micrarchaeota archaeon]